MGRRGTKPTSTKDLEARGSWRAKLREGEPQPSSDRPACPEWLAGEARDEWDRQIVDLESRGLLSSSYGAALAMFCAAWGEYVGAVKRIEGRGENGRYTVGSKGNLMVHPDVRILEANRDAATRLGKEFGFTPASVIGLTAKPKEKTKTDGKLRFFNPKAG